MTVVVDASVAFAATFDRGSGGTRCARRLEQATHVCAPELMLVEGLAAARRQHASGALLDVHIAEGMPRLTRLAQTFPHRPLLPRAWELRDNLSTYDATYVALAEALGAVLVTGDRGMATAPGPRCERELITA